MDTELRLLLLSKDNNRKNYLLFIKKHFKIVFFFLQFNILNPSKKHGNVIKLFFFNLQWLNSTRHLHLNYYTICRSCKSRDTIPFKSAGSVNKKEVNGNIVDESFWCETFFVYSYILV